MFDDRYIELEKLKKRNTIGVILDIIIFLMGFICPLVISATENVISYSNYLGYIDIGFVIICIILFIIITNAFCKPYRDYKDNLTKEIKDLILKQELNNTFNNSYKEEDSELLKNKIQDLGFIIHSSLIDDCFSAKYNDTKFNYGDVKLYYSDNDGTYIDFNGPVLEFDINHSLEGDIYIATKTNSLFGNNSIFKYVLKPKDCIEVKPTSSLLNENIIIKSNNKPSIIENSSFQQIINEFMNKGNYIFIFKNNKLYVLLYNYKNNFEITIRNKEDEIKAKEIIREHVNLLRNELDSIIRYKDVLNIKTDTF